MKIVLITFALISQTLANCMSADPLELVLAEAFEGAYEPKVAKEPKPEKPKTGKPKTGKPKTEKPKKEKTLRPKKPKTKTEKPEK